MVMVAVNVSMQKGDEKEKGFNTSYGGVDLRSTKQSCDFVHFEKSRLGKKRDDRFVFSKSTGSGNS